jgi:hypothetical protein
MFFCVAYFPLSCYIQSILNCRSYVLLSRGRVGKFFIPLACVGLIASYVFGEASSWPSFVVLSLTCVAAVVLAFGWVDRFVMRLLMRNFEWMFLAVIIVLYVAVGFWQISVSDGRSELRIGNSILWPVLWFFAAFFCISLDAIVSPSRVLRPLVVSIFLANQVIVIVKSSLSTNLVSSAPFICVSGDHTSVNARCVNSEAVRLQMFVTITVFALKYAVACARSPGALMIMCVAVSRESSRHNM